MKDETDEARIAKTERKRTKKKVEEKEEEKDLIKIRMVEEMVSRRFHKYLKVFEKKDSERVLTRKL